MFQFSDKSDEIDLLLARSKKKWTLDAVQWMDYEDVSQLIRMHIHDKWDLWDQTRTFGPWCNTVISHQIFNLTRNNYTSFQKPCLKCPHYMSDTHCSLTKSGQQDTSCDIYAKWSKKKKYVHDIRLPLSIENQVLDNSVCVNDQFDYDKSIPLLHKKVMEKIQNDKHKTIYQMLYVECLDDSVVINTMISSPDLGSEKSDKKKLDVLKKKFYELGKQVVNEEDIL